MATKSLQLFPLALAFSLACATLEEVAPGCGNRVVEESEDCDGVGANLCGEQDTLHQCRFVWDETNACPAGYVASPDTRCRKGSGELLFSAIIEAPGSDPQIADFGGDGTVELGMSELNAEVLTLYAVNASAAEPIGALPTFGVVALGELSGDASTDIVSGTRPVSKTGCVDGDPVDGGATNAGLSVLRSVGEDFSLKVYANSTYGDAVRFAALPTWLFGGCEVFDLDVLVRLAIVDGLLEICAVDDCEGTKATIAETDPETKLDLDSNGAYAVASRQGGAALVYVAREGFESIVDAFEAPDFLQLANGATVEAGIALADLNGDELEDVVVMGKEADDSFALYVLTAKPPTDPEVYPTLDGNELQRWLPIPGWLPGEGGSTAFETADFNGDSIPDFFLGDRVLVSTGVPVPPSPVALETYYRSECLITEAFSKSGSTCLGSVPGAVGDVNGDGIDDLVATGVDVFDSPTIQLLLGGDSLPLVRVTLQSDALGPGYLSTVALSDFDGDGAADVLGSFRPTQNGQPISPGEACAASEVLVLAYGTVGSFPEAPTVIAQVPDVRQITAGKFREPADAFGDFAVAVSCGSSATLFGDPYRGVSSPFLFDDDDTQGFLPSRLLLRDVVTSEDDALDGDSQPIPHPDLIVQVQSLSGVQTAPRVLLLPSWGDAELSLVTKRELAAPLRWQDVDFSPLALGVEADRGVVALAGLVQIFEQTGDGQTVTIEGDWAISQFADSGETTNVALPFPESLVVPLSIDENIDSRFAFGRAATADFNADGVPDFALAYGAPVSSQVVATDNAGVKPEGGGRVGSAVVLALSEGAGYVTKAVSGLEGEFDAPVDVAVLDGRLLVVGQQSLYTVDVESGLASFSSALGFDAASEAAVADFSGDGLNDVMVFDGTSGYLLEQLPFNP